MTATSTLEEQLLRPAVRALEQSAGPDTARRLDVLEGVASRLGGYSLGSFRTRFAGEYQLSTKQSLEAADTILSALRQCPINPSLALSAMARPLVNFAQRRESGAYYTDFRLAQYLVAALNSPLGERDRVIDPAAGSGILLVAAALAVCGPDRVRRGEWLASKVHAADLDPVALRGARLSLASLSNDLGAVKSMVGNWRTQDSLLSDSLEHHGYDVVLANPPWNKLKVTRHDVALAAGDDRHYGADYDDLDEQSLAEQRAIATNYSRALTGRYSLMGGGEADLYKAFLELCTRLSRPGGRVSILVPAGLIRSQGTEDLRRFLVDDAETLAVTVIENRARFFAIDTRFKFLAVSLKKRRPSVRAATRMTLLHAEGSDSGVKVRGKAAIAPETLRRIRPDLTVPEVRSDAEWKLFRSMSLRCVSGSDPSSGWYAEIVREVDMTRDRRAFSRRPSGDALPVIEGRMVHQHRFGAKAYQYGSGRKAIWQGLPLGESKVAPQFWCPRATPAGAAAERTDRLRAGFCDITGQTNERTMLAALIPAGVVCGNKVPTVTFPNDPEEARLLLWVAVVNSLPFDWGMRRIVTTTVNFFLLRSAPFPRIEPSSLPGRRLVEAARELSQMDQGVLRADPWRAAELRASIDVGVAAAYQMSFEDFELLLRDFPLLDRGQPPLPGEERSTITRDFVLAKAQRRLSRKARGYEERLRMAQAAGAVPYVPSEFVAAGTGENREASDAKR